MMVPVVVQVYAASDDAEARTASTPLTAAPTSAYDTFEAVVASLKRGEVAATGSTATTAQPAEPRHLGFARACAKVYTSLGLWCLYRAVELELEKAVESPVHLASPVPAVDPLALLLWLQRQRAQCAFAASPKLLKVEVILMTKLLLATEDALDVAEDAPLGPKALGDDDEDIDELSNVWVRSLSQRPTLASSEQAIVFAESEAEGRVLSAFLNEKLAVVGESSCTGDGGLQHVSECFFGDSEPQEPGAAAFAASGRSRVLVSAPACVGRLSSLPPCKLVVVAAGIFHNIRLFRDIQDRAQPIYEGGRVYCLVSKDAAGDRTRFWLQMREAIGIEFVDSDDLIEDGSSGSSPWSSTRQPASPVTDTWSDDPSPHAAARVNLSLNVKCINEFCLSIPGVKPADLANLYSFAETKHARTQTPLFQARLQLPTLPRIGSSLAGSNAVVAGPFEGDFRGSKTLARASAAVSACEYLLRLGYLDANLGSVFRTGALCRERVRVSACRALLSPEVSIKSINEFCQSLPGAKPELSTSLYVFEQRKDERTQAPQFRAKLHLPPLPHKRVDAETFVPPPFIGAFQTSKTLARAAAAELACNYLLPFGYLDGALVSVFRSGSAPRSTATPPLPPPPLVMPAEAGGGPSAAADPNASAKCINEFCQSLPDAKPELLANLYVFEQRKHERTQAPQFRAKLHLPPLPQIHSSNTRGSSSTSCSSDIDSGAVVKLSAFQGTFQSSKSLARASAAALACEKLAKLGYLDASLRSAFRKGLERAGGLV